MGVHLSGCNAPVRESGYEERKIFQSLKWGSNWELSQAVEECTDNWNWKEVTCMGRIKSLNKIMGGFTDSIQNEVNFRGWLKCLKLCTLWPLTILVVLPHINAIFFFSFTYYQQIGISKLFPVAFFPCAVHFRNQNGLQVYSSCFFQLTNQPSHYLP